MNREDKLLERITVNPKIFGGKPIIRGRRLAVEHIIGMLAAGDTPEIYAFLRDALKAVSIKAPFRGPEEYEQGSLDYSNRILGNVARFSGVEMINREGKPIYQLHYSGGILKD